MAPTTTFAGNLVTAVSGRTFAEPGHSEHTLEWLISPIGIELFSASYWSQSPLRIIRKMTTYYAKLFSEENFESALFAASIVPGAIEELGFDQRPHRVRSYTVAREAFRNGKSLRIDGVQRFSRELILFSRALEQEFSCPININLYLTPGHHGARALDRHYDTHDVFVLQVHGQKKWRVYDSAISFPLEYLPPIRSERHGRRRQRVLKKKESNIRESCKVADEFILQAGDLLYLPHGYWHEAEGTDGDASCHLTVGVQSSTYLELLTIAMTHAAARVLELRKPLPLGFGTHADCRVAVREHVEQILNSIRPEIDSDAALNEVAEIFARSRQSVDGGLLQSATLLDLTGISLSSCVKIRDGLICRVSSNGTNVSLHFGSVVVTLPIVFEAACRFIARGIQFIPREIPGDLADEERVSLAQRLIKDGLLASSDTRTQDKPQPVLTFRGWIPAKLSFRRKKSAIEWLYFGRESWTEPFFHQTVKRVKEHVPNAPTRSTGLKVLSRFQDEIAPSGFIFHVSRCGSTLISNALKTIHGTIVISEGQPFGAIFGAQVQEFGDVTGWEAKRDGLLKGIVRAFGQRRTGDETGLVVKFSSWDILSFSLVRRLWPAVPCVIVIRNPIEVMVSCIQKPPGWMRFKQKPKAASRIFGWSEDVVSKMTNEQFCARGIAEFFRAGAAGIGPECRVLSYEDLKAPRAIDVAKFFGLDLSGFGQQKLDGVFATYAKDPEGKVPFVDDRKEKQSAATDVMRRECKKWAEEPYLLLKQHENW